MDFNGGFAAGLGAGMGAGIAAGICSGRKQSLERVRQHVESNGITLLDRYGAPVKIDDLLAAVGGLSSRCCGQTRVLLVMLTLGIAVAVAIAVIAGLVPSGFLQ